MAEQFSPLERLLTRPIAITTVQSSDVANFKNITHDSFFRWYVGPSLLRGSIVGVYVPKSAEEVDETEKGRIRYLFSVVRDTIPTLDDGGWHNRVFLNRCYRLETAITLEELTSDAIYKVWQQPRNYFKNAGWCRDPLSYEAAKAFWGLVLDHNPDQAKMIADVLIRPTDPGLADEDRPIEFEFDVALSYAREDKPIADALKAACEQEGLDVFTDTGHVAGLAGHPLPDSLSEIFQRKANLFVPLISEAYQKSEWTSYERELAFARAIVESRGFIVPITLDGTTIPRFGGDVLYLKLDDESDGDVYSPQQIASILSARVRGQ